MGAITSALVPILAEWVQFSFVKRGITNAAVLPDPVLAMATTSFPAFKTGMHSFCIGVG